MAGNCKTCKFWLIERPEYTFGFCRRFPPHPERYVSAKPSQWKEGIEVTIQDFSRPIWPQTNEMDWCGEHAKEVEF